MPQTYNVAIIGLGVIGRRMLTNMPKQGRLRIAGGWDRDPAVCAQAVADFPGLVIADSAEALIASGGVDLVYIGVPPRAHGVYSRAAMAAGKAVFCEKPLGVDLDDSRALVAQAQKAGAVQAVNLSLAAARGVGVMRQALADGSLGRIAGADIRLHFTRWPRGWQASATWLAGRAEGGFTREVATHFLYLSDALFGPGELIAASAAYPGGDEDAETHILAQLEFGGVPVTLAGSVGGAGPVLVEFTLWGEARSYRLGDFYRLSSSTGDGWEDALTGIENPALDAYMLQLDEVVKMLDGAPHVLPNFAGALRVQELVEGILAPD
ncbi:Gfo/Idh/MocA family oxidoreductase [Limibaculum sp. M0105]|uniref:Gfo/Idh/MocA family oxidoreductase n=1 Tax=Thermohalobaculum xanthum TaxID=2753746 RepID=A0A8J7M9A9_9RHOB|nr:Gfo/Idh/MocA family oxidoreductase [Thermohalobaculum xanthum]MBK0401081.1 Gfo/Idh/MocA family oxidoreductase [Thermohalobaculum xanthum]